MNWAQFIKCNLGLRAQIEPPACRLNDLGLVLPEWHDDWIVERFGDSESVVLRNLRTDHIAELGKDHIYDFRSNPARSKDGMKYGFLILKVQIFIQGDRLWIRPNAKPGEHVVPSNRPHHQIQWTTYARIQSDFIAPTATNVTLQYRLWSDEGGIPLLIRISSVADGGLMREYSGPSGVVTLLLEEPQVIYVSFSHPKVNYELQVLGWQDSI